MTKMTATPPNKEIQKYFAFSVTEEPVLPQKCRFWIRKDDFSTEKPFLSRHDAGECSGPYRSMVLMDFRPQDMKCGILKKPIFVRALAGETVQANEISTNTIV